MFRDTRRKRLRNTVICAALGVLVLTLGIWMNYRTIVSDEAEEAAKKVKVEETEKSQKSESSKKNEGSTAETAEVPEIYLVKEVDGVVKVFLCDNEGNRDLYLITSIPFSLLSEEDQKLFEDGVYMETEDDLGKFLENFDS